MKRKYAVIAQQCDYFHSLFIFLSPANEIKATTADMKFF